MTKWGDMRGTHGRIPLTKEKKRPVSEAYSYRQYLRPQAVRLLTWGCLKHHSSRMTLKGLLQTSRSYWKSQTLPSNIFLHIILASQPRPEVKVRLSTMLGQLALVVANRSHYAGHQPHFKKWRSLIVAKLSAWLHYTQAKDGQLPHVHHS